MTEEEVLAMEAGTTLDILVNENVMDYPIPDFIPENALELYLAGTPFHCNGWSCICIYSEGDVPKWVPDKYSTNISAAWQVVDKMKLEDTWIKNTFWSTLEKMRGPLSLIYWLTPEVICKAALLTKLEGGER